ncbi:MAG: LacI family DNA-binding transcriptional regulator [Sphingomicrobium sp.]
MTRRLTSEDVARAAGVSASAVSRAFTPGASVSADKKARILRAAAALGYRPNIMARAVATRRSNVIGLILFNETNRHYPDVLLALSSAFSAVGIRVMLFLLDDDDEVDATIEHILSYQLDGVVAAAPIPTVSLGHLRAARVPLLFYNRPGEDEFASVSCDHEASGSAIARHVLSAGHRSVALIRAYPESSVGNERMLGVEQELARGGATIVADYHGDFDYDAGLAAVLDWDARRVEPFTAVIAANDMMAIGAKDGLVHRLGKRVPGDIMVAGFDGIEAARWLGNAIPTVAQPIEQMSLAAAAMMVERIADPTLIAERRLFPGRLVIV